MFVPNAPAKEIVFILILLPSPSRINASRFFLSRKFAGDSHRIAKQVLDLSQQLLQAPLDRREGVLTACFAMGATCTHSPPHPSPVPTVLPIDHASRCERLGDAAAALHGRVDSAAMLYQVCACVRVAALAMTSPSTSPPQPCTHTHTPVRCQARLCQLHDQAWAPLPAWRWRATIVRARLYVAQRRSRGILFACPRRACRVVAGPVR